MARGDAIYYLGEKSPVYGDLSATGLETYVSATFTLYDDDGAVVAGFNGIGVTGNSGSGTTLLTVWYLLDTTSLSDGYYTAIFWIGVSTPDGMTRKKPVVTDVYIRAAP
jgi:hypothetical protein